MTHLCPVKTFFIALCLRITIWTYFTRNCTKHVKHCSVYVNEGDTVGPWITFLRTVFGCCCLSKLYVVRYTISVNLPVSSNFRKESHFAKSIVCQRKKNFYSFLTEILFLTRCYTTNTIFLFLSGCRVSVFCGILLSTTSPRWYSE